MPCNIVPNAPIAPVPHVLPQETTTQEQFDELLGIHLENEIENYEDSDNFRFLVKFKIFRKGFRASRTCLGFKISDKHVSMK